MTKLKMLSIPLLTLISVVGAEGSVPAERILFSRVRYSNCANVERLQPYFESTVKVGVGRLEELNPGLAARLVTKFESTDLIIACMALPSQLTKEALAGPRPAAAMDRKRNRMEIGESFQVLENSDPLETQPLEIASGKYLYDNTKRQILIHELLHWSRADNFSVKVHNDLERYGHSRDEDVVYSCAGAVFPGMEEALHKVTLQLLEKEIDTCRNAPSDGRRSPH